MLQRDAQYAQPALEERAAGSTTERGVSLDSAPAGAVQEPLLEPLWDGSMAPYVLRGRKGVLVSPAERALLGA